MAFYGFADTQCISSCQDIKTQFVPMNFLVQVSSFAQSSFNDSYMINYAELSFLASSLFFLLLVFARKTTTVTVCRTIWYLHLILSCQCVFFLFAGVLVCWCVCCCVRVCQIILSVEGSLRRHLMKMNYAVCIVEWSTNYWLLACSSLNVYILLI